jgi:mRNA deadenylase 3'-5' endonuclease subunit Ccr4
MAERQNDERPHLRLISSHLSSHLPSHHPSSSSIDLLLYMTMRAMLFKFLSFLLLFLLHVFLFHHSTHALQTPLQQKPIRLLTWNLLAPLYASASKYPRSDPSYLDWSYRKPRILQTILDSEADIICLQEVQIDLWEDFCMPGYTAISQNMTDQHPVGCAVLIRSNQNWKVVATESRSRALIVVLEDQAQEQQRLYLAVVHLEAGYEKEETRWNQMKSLLKRVHRHVGKNDDSNPAIVLAGDFNTCTRSSPLFSVLSGNCQDGLLQKRKLPMWKGLSSFFSSDLTKKTSAGNNQPPWKRILPLVNVHQSDRPDLTYAGGSVLDYIWISPGAIQVHETLSWSPRIDAYNQKDSAYKQKDSGKELCPPQPWPSKECPSDHVPIGAVFSLKTSQSNASTARRKPKQ